MSTLLGEHLASCKLNEKRFKKLCKILQSIRKKSTTSGELLHSFALKCYGKEPDRNLASSQAQTFLEALFGSVEDIQLLGPDQAMSNKLRDMEKAQMQDAPTDVIPLNRTKSVDFNIYEHGSDDPEKVESSSMWKYKLGKYLIGPTLGVGGTATVKLGWDTVEKEQVAMKILSPKYAFSANKEINVLKKLSHNNIIRVYDCFHDVKYKGSKTTIFVIEYANEGELIEYLMYTGKFQAPLARWFFEKLLDGMEYCHKRKVAHRDLKHDNCLLGNQFELKITDFGFARYFFTEKNMLMKTAIGTAQYAAPEILAGQPYDEAVDIFSMGVMLFIALAGSQPWRRADPNTDKWYRMVHAGTWEKFWNYHKRTHTFSEDAKRLLEGILEPDPKKRFGFQEIKATAWYKNIDKYNQTEAMNVLRKRKREMDEKKWKENQKSGARGTRKAVDAKEIHNKNPPEKHWQNNPAGLWFATEEYAPFMLEEIQNAVTKRGGKITSLDETNYEINFELVVKDTKKTKKKKEAAEPDEEKKKEMVHPVHGFVKIWRQPQKVPIEKPRNMVVFKRTNGERMRFPLVYAEMLTDYAHLMCLKPPVPLTEEQIKQRESEIAAEAKKEAAEAAEAEKAAGDNDAEGEGEPDLNVLLDASSEGQ